MANRLRVNNVKGTVAAMASGDASVTLGSALPAAAVPVSGTSYLPIIIESDTANEEIVWITGPASSGTTYPITRNVEGSTAIAHSAGAFVHGPTAQDLTTAARFKGAWSSTATYDTNDLVTDAYGLYVALLASTNADPTAQTGPSTLGASDAATTISGSTGVYTSVTPFTVNVATNITAVTLNNNAVSGGNIRVGIASSLGANESSITYLGVSNAGTTTTGLQTFTLTSAAAVVPGTTYYVVAQGTSGTGADGVGFRTSAATLSGGVVSCGTTQYATAAGGGWASFSAGYHDYFSLTAAPNQSWQKLANVRESSVVAKTAAYTMVDPDTTVLANGTFTVTLPAASTTNVGKRYTIKNTGTGTITIAPASGTIDGAANKALAVQYSSVDVVTDGTNWFEV